MAYREKNKIIVRDIFDETICYKEIASFGYQLSESAEPFTDVKFINNGESLEVTYLTGDDYNEVTEIFEIYCTE